MESTRINLLDVGMKARSKSEIYKILTIKDGLFLMNIKECGMAFISDI